MQTRVVLVEPENPLNIGFVARAMRASGVKDLVIVGAAARSMSAEAFVTGVSAPEILNSARFVADLPAALSGCDASVAFSRRPSALKQDEFTLPAAPALPPKTALVFGRESKGLTREETAQCRYLARIPNKNGVSLNLGQAVAVALFALSPAEEAKPAADAERASQERLNALWELVEPRLLRTPRFNAARRLRARQMIQRLRLDGPDASLLMSVMKELSR